MFTIAAVHNFNDVADVFAPTGLPGAVTMSYVLRGLTADPAPSVAHVEQGIAAVEAVLPRVQAETSPDVVFDEAYSMFSTGSTMDLMEFVAETVDLRLAQARMLRATLVALHDMLVLTPLAA